jgi:hypothetical protein
MKNPSAAIVTTAMIAVLIDNIEDAVAAKEAEIAAREREVELKAAEVNLAMREAEVAKAEIERIMCEPPAWAEGLPLAVEAKIMTRYGKG